MQLRKLAKKKKVKETREGIVKSTPKTVKVQSSIGLEPGQQPSEASSAVLVDNGNITALNKG